MAWEGRSSRIAFYMECLVKMIEEARTWCPQDVTPRRLLVIALQWLGYYKYVSCSDSALTTRTCQDRDAFAMSDISSHCTRTNKACTGRESIYGRLQR